MTVIAYHFTGDKLRDGRPIPPIGETLYHEDKIVWCESGLYASRRASQALQFALGPLLHMVACDGIEFEDEDKFACRRRTILKSVNAERMLRRFAADQALSVAHLWDMPPVVREYLTTLDGALQDAAWDAAWAAARAAAWDAAWAASRAAARAAAWDAAWAAARAAARAAAWDAAWAAARDAAWAAARDDFDARVARLFEEAAPRMCRSSRFR